MATSSTSSSEAEAVHSQKQAFQKRSSQHSSFHETKSTRSAGEESTSTSSRSSSERGQAALNGTRRSNDTSSNRETTTSQTPQPLAAAAAAAGVGVGVQTSQNDASASSNVGISKAVQPQHSITSKDLKPLAPNPNMIPFQVNPVLSSTITNTTSTSPSPQSASIMAAASSSSGPPKVIHTKQVKKGSRSGGGYGQKLASSGLRRGKWTVEEETYVARVIQDFNSGFLNAPAGTTLRSYLSEKLQCDPMRITKKFTGEACIGKRVFHPAVRSSANSSSIDKAQMELDTLERRWRRRLEMQQRESAKKAAASAAASSATSPPPPPPPTPIVGSTSHAMIQGVPVALLSSAVTSPDVSSTPMGQNVVTQAASWLDRANAILKGAHIQGFPMVPPTSESPPKKEKSEATGNSTPDSAIEHEIQEVQRLIYEGPHIQQSAAGLQGILTSSNQRKSSILEGPPSPPEPADKRMRTGSAISGSEDAEALVGFLRSVRAAAGEDTS